MKNKQKESMLQIKSKLSLKSKYKGLFVILLFYVPLLSICKTELYTIVAHLQKLKQTFYFVPYSLLSSLPAMRLLNNSCVCKIICKGQQPCKNVKV